MSCIFTMTLTKISERIYADTEGTNGGNFGAVVLDDEIVIIDSGMFHHLTKEARELLEKEHQLPVLKLLLTHVHADHVWGAQAFNPVTMISSKQTYYLINEALKDSWSPAGVIKWAEESKETRPNLWKASRTLSIKLPDLVFDESLRIGANQEITMQHVGGHTLGSSIVVIEPEHVCFCGDIIFHRSFPYAGDPTCDPDKWITVLEDIKNADYSMIVPGHGPLCDNEDIQVIIDFFNEFRQIIKNSIEEGLTADDFIERGLIPNYHNEGAEHRVRISIERWFEYYRG